MGEESAVTKEIYVACIGLNFQTQRGNVVGKMGEIQLGTILLETRFRCGAPGTFRRSKRSFLKKKDILLQAMDYQQHVRTTNVLASPKREDITDLVVTVSTNSRLKYSR